MIARQKRNAKDTLAILTTFADRDTFAFDPNLRNIITGVNADKAVEAMEMQGRRHVICIGRLGMECDGSQVLPRMTDLPAALDSLLRMIRCNCSSDCASARCTGRKHGIECSLACCQCRAGTACSNSPNQSDDDDSQHE